MFIEFLLHVICLIGIAFTLCRCEDANLLDMPVKIENANKSIYHVAFFTKRLVEAREELTWDYGNDFSLQDPDLPSFACKCGSSMCRYRVSPLLDRIK